MAGLLQVSVGVRAYFRTMRTSPPRRGEERPQPRRIEMSKIGQRSVNMSRASLREFISSVLVRKRLRFGDLRRLQRDVLPTGIATREEAEAVITLDQALSKA